MSYRGSEWRKWDLHFHTPSSYDYKDKSQTNEQIIEKLIENNISVVAITDHHIIDIARIKDLSRLADGRITILPGIEFLSETRGNEPIHFIGIFQEQSKCKLDYIWGQLENNTAIKHIKGENKEENEVYCDLEETVKLIHKLGGIVSIHAGGKHSSIENITHCLPHAAAQKTDIAHAIDIYELGKESDQDGYKKVVFPSIKKVIPMIICSDNHDIKNYTLKQNCWIKAEPTFEGLKQIIYEPEGRIYIGATYPAMPIYKIDNVKLNFDENTLWENMPFCFRGINEFFFSPNFTCIIGGRGSGKSTLVNLIAQKNGDKQEQLKNLKCISGQTIDSSMSFLPTTINNLEYLAQNKIEEFAKDSKKFTDAIFERINKISNGDLSGIELILETKLEEIKKQIERYKSRNLLHSELQKRKKQLSINQDIISTFKDEEYLINKRFLSEITSKIQDIDNSQKKYTLFTSTLNSLLELHDIIEEEKNSYDVAYNEIRLKLSAILSETSKKAFETEVEKKAVLKSDQECKMKEISDFLRSKNLSDENIKDVSAATGLTELLKNEIQSIKKRLLILKNEIQQFNFESLENLSSTYFEKINIELSNINDKFRAIQLANSSDVKLIKVQYKLNTNIKYQIMEKLNIFLELENKISSVRSTFYEYLFRIPFDEVDGMNARVFIERLTEKCNTGTKAFELLKEIFENDLAFKIYKLIIKQCKYDFKTNKILEVLYDEKSLELSSFGQRCTAAIVVLLSLGNNPIIIDEPEAHLDSSLIATYLVELIKEQKQHRQIIFATHNANFVLNADAELIIKLENIDGLTTKTSFAIENIENREHLLKLEGGALAFKKREQKYNIRKG